jgi:replication-associated recombination protein RarA
VSALLPFPQPLTEKYRPTSVEDFIGLAKPKAALTAFIKAPFPSYWMFLGGSGLGKTALCQAIANEINAELQEIPSASCDLDAVERAVRICSFGAFNFKTGKSCDWHLLAVHEADSMTPMAQKSFLSKTDSTAAPPKTIMIFTCNSVLNLEGRFLSRCNLLKFENDSMEGELESYLAKIYKKEGGKYPVNFCDIAKSCGYNVRDALNKLQVELLLGKNRKGLPTDELKIVEAHTHFCKAPKCGKTWRCQNPLCDLPFRSVCPDCGGAKTIGSERAKMAHRTMKAKAIAEYEAKKKPSRP